MGGGGWLKEAQKGRQGEDLSNQAVHNLKMDFVRVRKIENALRKSILEAFSLRDV